MVDAIILAGERNPDSSRVPKALLRVKRKELISHQVDYLKDKVSKIIVSVGSGKAAKEIEDYVYDAHPELAVLCIKEHKPLGTAGAIKNCIEAVDTERVLVLNCDDLCDINIPELEKIPDNVICVQSPVLPFGIIKRNAADTKRLLGNYSFIERPTLKGIYTSCGWYLLKKSLIQKFPLIGNIETGVFPKLNFNVYRHVGHWNTFNTQKDVEIYEIESKIE